MISGIYDQKGRLIKTTIERIEDENIPESSEVTEGTVNITVNSGKNTYSTSNFGGNIIIPDRLGNVGVFIGIR